jgi:thiol-disulfide isomerase/thioredoxin
MSVFKKNSGVIELTPSNFDSNNKIKHPALKDGKKGLVAFTCSWCGYCVKLAKPYSETAQITGMAFPMFNVDCVKYPELANSMKVSSYPTIKYIDFNGNPYKDYSKEREMNVFLKDICRESKICKRK